MKHKAVLWSKDFSSGNTVKCGLCAHFCSIPDKSFGICGVRQNISGELFTFSYGNIIAANIDPIEKKPLYHFLPGSYSYSIAIRGCNFKCGFCQNWTISQSRYNDKEKSFIEEPYIEPEKIVSEALRTGCKSISYTYTEPTVFFEYAYDIAKIAKGKGLYNIFVSNGYMSERAIDMIAPYLSAINIDLKFFTEDSYNKICKASLKPVLDSIKRFKKNGVWVEVTTLLIPGKNDSTEEVEKITDFIAYVSDEIPWHITRFHPDYQFTDYENTPLISMNNAEKIGKRKLKYVYLGNIGKENNSLCPKCGKIVVSRQTDGIKFFISKDSSCYHCSAQIPGVWG
ncbi:radical SAM domain-containing protein [Candidatus Omnitrophus magneticus]|uniref:Radical SAM domain-containing protein n=1 Tax=Candidatus Omnitrophus magneticus TaxID=1609969 RepID=A0A0F0CJA4_9BACT|nr:radical SAM domain-containing protein [Candidatus Omnitrophus magneticus]